MVFAVQYAVASAVNQTENELHVSLSNKETQAYNQTDSNVFTHESLTNKSDDQYQRDDRYLTQCWKNKLI